jgi:histone H3/H4
MTKSGKVDREQMKSLSFGMVSDISRLLADKGFGERAIDIVEALAFAMFIIADTYSLAKSDKEKAIEIIHGFYDDIQDHFINKILIQDHNLSDAAEIEAAATKFHDLSRERFNAYGGRFKEDIADPMALSCPTTVSYLLDNLFIEPVAKEEKLQLMGAVSEKVLFFWSGCVQAFKLEFH